MTTVDFPDDVIAEAQRILDREARRLADRPRMLTTREVAEWLGFSPATVLRRWRAGELPGYRLGTNVLRFDEIELTAWLETRRRRMPPPIPQPRRGGPRSSQDPHPPEKEVSSWTSTSSSSNCP